MNFLRSPRNASAFAREVEEQLGAALDGLGLTVYRGRHYGISQPDLVAVDQSGNAYIIEIKGGPHRTRPIFSDLAQIKAYGSDVQKALGVRSTSPALVTNGAVSPELDSLSQELGIVVFQAEEPDEVPDRVLEWVRTKASE